jgi:uncharacterized protein GlcG (DUF336 family)
MTLKTFSGLSTLLIATIFVTGCNNAIYIPSVGKKTIALKKDDVAKILDQAEAAAGAEKSLVRVDDKGATAMTRMHIYVIDARGQIIGRRNMSDAWDGSISIAKAKAYTAMAFSSNQNALTSRTIGLLSQPGGPLWQIGNSNTRTGLIEFPGGIPLYKDGKLVGAIGVSGDGVDQDENVAEAGSKGFEAPKGIRVDTVLKKEGLYTK